MATIKVVEKEIKYKFHKWKKQLLIADKVIYVLVVLFLGIFSPDYVVIAAYLLIIPYILLTQRKSLYYHFVIASIVASVWMFIAKDEYGYNRNFITVAGINFYPLFAWAIGLFGAYVIYSHYEHLLKEQGFLHQFLLFVAFYWPLLISVETIAYHIFNIRNLATTAYLGLPICNCIHAPRWMQAAYFAMGPIFFTICYAMKLENPHIKILKK